MFKNNNAALAILSLAIIWGGGFYASIVWKQDHPVHVAEISDSARHHILEGDARGGGHRHGAGKNCKSEFPVNWDDQSIIEHVQDIAANDNLNWRQQKNGYYIAEQTIEGVNVRVVVNRDRSDVVTAYPMNGKRNACAPRPYTNDNFNK